MSIDMYSAIWNVYAELCQRIDK